MAHTEGNSFFSPHLGQLSLIGQEGSELGFSCCNRWISAHTEFSHHRGQVWTSLLQWSATIFSETTTLLPKLKLLSISKQITGVDLC